MFGIVEHLIKHGVSKANVSGLTEIFFNAHPEMCQNHPDGCDGLGWEGWVDEANHQRWSDANVCTCPLVFEQPSGGQHRASTDGRTRASTPQKMSTAGTAV